MKTALEWRERYYSVAEANAKLLAETITLKSPRPAGVETDKIRKFRESFGFLASREGVDQIADGLESLDARVARLEAEKAK